MPESAISSGMIDFAVPVGEMGARLVEFAHSFSVLDNLSAAVAKEDEGTPESDAHAEIYVLLRTQMGHDFSGYKTKTFFRRVQRRMQVNRLDTMEGYVEQLRRDPKEVAALFRDLLINVTNFFRDADAFDALRDQVIPKMFDGRGADETVRVWVPGCATGEEVFSIAMLMREHMDGLRNVPRVQLFATDIDEQVLTVARAARYPEALLDSVSEERRRRFFVRDGGSFLVAKDIRDMCIFSPHSVLRDPPFSRIDLVSCCNLLIYFGAEAQNQVIPTFRYALKPGGWLFLGTSESISQFDDLFSSIDKKNRLFRARDDGGSPPRLPLALPGIGSRATRSTANGRLRPLGVTPLRQAVEEHVLQRHVPPHVVVTTEGEIVYYSARMGKYFEAPAGALNRTLLVLACKGLRLDLRSTFRDAVETGQQVTCDGVEFENDDGRIQQLALSVEPLGRVTDEQLFLVTFKDYGPTLTAEEARNRAGACQPVDRSAVPAGVDQPVILLLCAGAGDGRDAGADGGDRRLVPRSFLLWQPPDGTAPPAARPRGWAPAGAAPDGGDGARAHLPALEDERSAPGAPDLPISAARSGDHAAEPGLVRRHHLPADAARLPLSGRDHGLGVEEGARLAAVEHDGRDVLRRGSEGSAGALRQARDLQHGPGKPVHQHRLHRRAAQRRGADQHGRARPLDGQRLHRAALAIAEVRVRLPERL